MSPEVWGSHSCEAVSDVRRCFRHGPRNRWWKPFVTSQEEGGGKPSQCRSACRLLRCFQGLLQTAVSGRIICTRKIFQTCQIVKDNIRRLVADLLRRERLQNLSKNWSWIRFNSSAARWNSHKTFRLSGQNSSLNFFFCKSLLLLLCTQKVKAL